jgi:hypothetical protein
MRTGAAMANAQGWSGLGSWRRGGLLLAAALTMLPAGASFAQSPDVSGVPLGPANVNGQNNTGRDPSGVGNASKVAPLPESSVHPVAPTAAPLNSTRVGRVGVSRPNFSHLPPRQRRIAEKAAVKEYDKLLKHGAVSICKGC